MSKEKSSKLPQDQSSQLVVNKTPAPFVGPLRTGWPWDITIIEVPALLQKIGLPQACHDEVRQLLIDLSSVIVSDGLPDDVDRRSIKLGEKGIDSRKDWVERITRLPPSDRLSCCGHSKANVRIVEGRALFLEQDQEDKLLFGNDPIAWIRNGCGHLINGSPPCTERTGPRWRSKRSG